MGEKIIAHEIVNFPFYLVHSFRLILQLIPNLKIGGVS